MHSYSLLQVTLAVNSTPHPTLDSMKKNELVKQELNDSHVTDLDVVEKNVHIEWLEVERGPFFDR